MGFYETRILPWLTALAMKSPAAARERARFVPRIRGRVLEIGIGSGLNLPFYPDGVSHLAAIDPSARLRKMAEKRVAGAPFPVDFIGLTGEDIPLDDNSVDTVLSTWTLCTIPHPARALAEMRRVLKPGGEFIFIEHGQAPDDAVARWQRRINPLWRRLAGGCNLDRRMEELIGGAGFRITDLERGYIKGPKVLAYTYRGGARPA